MLAERPPLPSPSAHDAPRLATSPDTGTLEGDLRELFQDMAFALSGEGGLLMRALIGEAAHNTVLAEALATAFLTPVRRRLDEIVERAVHRGEIAPFKDADLPGDLVSDPMVNRFLLTSMLPDRVERPPRHGRPIACFPSCCVLSGIRATAASVRSEVPTATLT